MKTLKIALVAAAAVSVALPAFAQYQPTEQYRKDMQTYQADRATYQEQREAYDQARAAYETRRDAYERERAAYDARYGVGAYARSYGPAPAWDQAYWDQRDAAAYGRDNAYRESYDQARTDYEARRDAYERERADYDARYGAGAYARNHGPAPVWDQAYWDRRDAAGRDTARPDNYEQARADYEARRDAYERERANYDARYGYGAYARSHGPAPAWDQAYWDQRGASGRDTSRRESYEQARAAYESRRDAYERERANYDARYGYGAYARSHGPAPTWDQAYWDQRNANAYGRNASYVDPCAGYRNDNRTVAGGLLGAVAGAALGSNVAARNARTEGAVLGAVVGGVIGANIGAAASKARCDEAGHYYNYADTVPYRESRYVRSGEYGYRYYQRQRCRLAPAPIDRTGDVRYIRVCPDRSGRYRITG
ncbi:MAG TPA: glycine zipper 2TM domain-containing protein [Phenylobacterium sp.]|nr:glycine zipper 2TM domain-containing protein [Phenylobacterium sp.]